jgi:hypothetical protein
MVQGQPRQIVLETLSQKTHHKKGLVEWLKPQYLQAPVPPKKKKKKEWGEGIKNNHLPNQNGCILRCY